jgi:type IV pili sensor histidine kinase/response regulator
MKLSNLVTGFGVALIMTTCGSHASDVVTTDRYTLTKVEPQGDQRRPLTAILSMTFGTDIRTVGEAITETLNGSGYRWEQHADDQSLTALPLPSVVRNLGPLRLKDALETIAGPAWILRVDELHRSVWFEVNPAASTPQ